MGRPSNREERRRQILAAFARMLAEHGYAGATIAAVAAKAGVAAGLIHHHFANKEELISELLRDLVGRFRRRVQTYQKQEEDPLLAYIDGALKLDEKADVLAAKCWVGIFSEAVRNPALFRRLRRLLDDELETIRSCSRDRLSVRESGAVLAYVVGALVVGAFAPGRTVGFAAPILRRLVPALQRGDSKT